MTKNPVLFNLRACLIFSPLCAMAYIIVPVRLDALCLREDQAVSGPMADFSRLPHWVSPKPGSFLDVHADRPFLSGNILAQPFEDQDFWLKKGVHLHWALPDTLTRSRTAKSGALEMPAAPNRWLVVRTQGTNRTGWVVESDFLHPPGGPKPDAITYPDFSRLSGGKQHQEEDSAALTASGFQPWRGLGRAVSAVHWTEPSTGDYLAKLPRLSDAPAHKLTALGWGDPNFAAFYPNCHSVFGFHDDPGDAAAQYEVLGWYSDPKDDILHPQSKFLADALNATAQKYGKNLAPDEIWKRAIAECFQWQCDETGTAENSLYYAKITLPAAVERKVAAPEVNLEFALGNTGTEAYSAFLARNGLGRFSPEQMEDRLEAIQFDGLLESLTVDTGFKFREARHEKGFAAVAGGSLWSVRRPDPKEKGGPAEEITLPPAVAHALNELNSRQVALDRAEAELTSLRRRLYADWCLFQQCCYPPQDQRESFPDPSHVQYFLEARVAHIGKRAAELEPLRSAVEAQRRSLESLLPKGCAAIKRAAPRYWKPVDPVLLMAGNGIEPTPRHGADGLLVCAFVSPQGTGIEAWLDVLENLPAPVLAAATQNWSAPWHPYLFEWEAEIVPLERAGNLEPQSRCYESGYLSENFSLNDDWREGCELRCREDDPDLRSAATLCSGRSLLTPQAPVGFRRHLAAWLLKHADDKKLPAREALADWSKADLPQRRRVADRLRDVATLWQIQLEWAVLAGWRDPASRGSLVLRADTENAKLADDFAAFKSMLESLADSKLAIQSQALSGLHEALLGQEQVFQLPLADPLGFPDRKAFVRKVSAAVAGHSRTAPLPMNDFLPLRTGYMKLLSVRLVDTFGQVHDLIRGGDVSRVTIANAMSLGGARAQHVSWLPPRFCQAARVDFRWLAAGGADLEMNSHPATSPICGWLLANHVDHSLQVHGPDGAVLGILQNEDLPADRCRIVWQPRPGRGIPVYPDNIPDGTLRRVVQWIIAQGANNSRTASFLLKYLDALDDALEKIHPAEFKAHESLALLMGRPLAVVRASLGVSVLGLPAAKHTWDAFRKDLRRAEVAECSFAPLAAAAQALDQADASLAPDGQALPLEDTAKLLHSAAEKLLEAATLLEELPSGTALPQKAQTLQTSLTTAGNVAKLREIARQTRKLHDEFHTAAAAMFGGVDRETDSFERVEIPLRIGEWQQLNDGLAGYWTEDEQGALSGVFYGSHVSKDEGVASIRSRKPNDSPDDDAATFHIPVAVADPARTIVMLMDPRGTVHATSGLLPTKALSIPPDQYAAALRSIQLFLLTTPILTPTDKIHLPLAREPGFSWTWLMQGPGQRWTETADLAPATAEGKFFTQQQILEGWLRLDPKDS
jgi:hypothetical protein